MDWGKDTGMPSGRFVSGCTSTPLGSLRIVGVCVPWRDAHVKTGRRDRNQWQDHLSFLTELRAWLDDRPDASVVGGDFNQRIPQHKQPELVYAALMASLVPRYSIPTAGALASIQKPTIDHVALSADLHGEVTAILPETESDGFHLSDHFGLLLSIQKPSEP